MNPWSQLALYFAVIRWTLAIAGNLFGGAGMVWWVLGFGDPQAAAYAIVCIVIAAAAEYARRATPT